MIRLTDLSVVDSFGEIIPGAGAFGDVYLRAVAGGVTEQSPPVTMALDEVRGAGMSRGETRDVLVVTPDKKRLRHYKTLHWAVPLGASLSVGWWLIGGDKADGYGSWNLGAISTTEVSEVESLVQLVHQCAVIPAVHTVAASVRQPPQGTSAGFFGV